MPPSVGPGMSVEAQRLKENPSYNSPWRRFGPYLSERQWGTVREDYSESGTAWDYFPHDHARSRAYRWGEDGIAGFSDHRSRLCLAVALWNGQDPILKERLFGLNNEEGNHGEDVKEVYYYLDATPTHSYLKMLYKYPQREFPYARLVHENRARGTREPELELVDTGAFDHNRYFDVFVEYAKSDPNDILWRIRVENRGPESAPIWILPQLWFRNTWSFKPHSPKPKLERLDNQDVHVLHEQLGEFFFSADGEHELVFTENETNFPRVFGLAESDGHYYKDAFHEYVIQRRHGAVSPLGRGTKCAALYQRTVAAGGFVELRCRLRQQRSSPAF
ncbi:MAG TPA: glucosidase, partial [Polyangiaceae bacterium]|nr:glucosidase [Polyangiaceae bacterium]